MLDVFGMSLDLKRKHLLIYAYPLSNLALCSFSVPSNSISGAIVLAPLLFAPSVYRHRFHHRVIAIVIESQYSVRQRQDDAG